MAAERGTRWTHFRFRDLRDEVQAFAFRNRNIMHSDLGPQDSNGSPLQDASPMATFARRFPSDRQLPFSLCRSRLNGCSSLWYA